jgi:hypothetical protein
MTDLDETIDELEKEYGRDGHYWNDPDHLAGVVKEVLEGADFHEYTEEGPEGPWLFKSLTLTRIGNKIFIRDVDGQYLTYLKVPDMSEVEYPKARLFDKLDELNEKSLDQL